MILGRDGTAAIPQLQDLIHRSRPPYRDAILAIRCLGYMGPAARPTLAELTGHTNQAVCSAAQIALIQTMPDVPDRNGFFFRAPLQTPGQ